MKTGDRVHLGIAQAGGAGFTGILLEIENGVAWVESETCGQFGFRRWKGPARNLTPANED